MRGTYETINHWSWQDQFGFSAAVDGALMAALDHAAAASTRRLE